MYDLGATELVPPRAALALPDADPRVDLDRDGLEDVEDPCIALATDALVDTDGDGVANAYSRTARAKSGSAGRATVRPRICSAASTS